MFVRKSIIKKDFLTFIEVIRPALKEAHSKFSKINKKDLEKNPEKYFVMGYSKYLQIFLERQYGIKISDAEILGALNKE